MPRTRKPERRELIRNPRTLVDLAIELMNCIDLYWCGDLSEAECREYINYTAKYHKLLSENGKDINITVKLKIGQRRAKLIESFLDGYQLHL